MKPKRATTSCLTILGCLWLTACNPSATGDSNALIPLPALGWDKADMGDEVLTTDESGGERILDFDSPVSGLLKPDGAFHGWFVEALPGSQVRIRMTPGENPDVRFFVFGPANREDGVEKYSLKIAWPGPAGQEAISDCIDGKLDEDDDWGLWTVIAYQFECMVEYADSLKEAGGVQTADASLTGGRYLVVLGTFDGEKGGAYTLQMSCANDMDQPCDCSYNQSLCDAVCVPDCLDKASGSNDGCGGVCGECSMDMDCADFGPDYHCSSQTGLCEKPD
jgi:hypothetical protein